MYISGNWFWNDKMKNVVLKNLLTVTSRIKTNLEIYYIF